MGDDPTPPIRPSDDPKVLVNQLDRSLAELAAQGTRYQGYLSQLVRRCFLQLQEGDVRSPQASLDLLSSALHVGERLVGSDEAIEAAAWVRATARFFEVAHEALNGRSDAAFPEAGLGSRGVTESASVLFATWGRGIRHGPRLSMNLLVLRTAGFWIAAGSAMVGVMLSQDLIAEGSTVATVFGWILTFLGVGSTGHRLGSGAVDRR